MSRYEYCHYQSPSCIVVISSGREEVAVGVGVEVGVGTVLSWPSGCCGTIIGVASTSTFILFFFFSFFVVFFAVAADESFFLARGDEDEDRDCILVGL